MQPPIKQTFNLESTTSNTKTIIANSTTSKTSSRLESTNTKNEEDDMDDLVPLDDDDEIKPKPSTTQQEDQQKQEQVVKWIYEQAEKEKRKLVKQKVNVEIIRAKNFGLVREEDKIWNRIECNTSPQQHFSTIAQVLVSAPTKCTLDQLDYVNIILLPKDMRRAFLVPYLYDPKIQENQLSHWTFIDTPLQHHKFVIENMRQI